MANDHLSPLLPNFAALAGEDAALIEALVRCCGHANLIH
jgi:hypothetical protein|tara:strand:- start:117 stop:233 length:117 start_codon:yes stop_codon:yes gene_type:complete